MNSAPDPYTTPAFQGVDNVAPNRFDKSGLIKEICWTIVMWELLRILYVLILGLVTISVLRNSILLGNNFEDILIGAVVANVCFCAGPFVECGLLFWGVKKLWIRISLFTIGTLFASFLTVEACSSF